MAIGGEKVAVVVKAAPEGIDLAPADGFDFGAVGTEAIGIPRIQFKDHRSFPFAADLGVVAEPVIGIDPAIQPQL